MTKFAVVTGSASGIGNFICHELSRLNYHVYALDIHNTKQINNVIPITVDLSDPESTKNTFDAISKIDLAINCAGVPSLRKSVSEFTIDEITKCWKENFSITFNSIVNELAKMKIYNKGKIINIASITAHKGMKNMLAYSSAKASVVNLTKVAAIENSDYGIQINSISPATIDTPWIRKKNDGAKRDYSRVYYTKDCGSVNDIFSAVKMFIDNNFLTGYDLKLDGGLTDLCVI
ncbi:SDR family oxidoreductase [Thiotrichales bacterium 19X7-9]|nr:SDR family oxidoreductase [Thiotrichales bacterium 19X7-9]